MSSRILGLALASTLLILTHAPPSSALSFTQDSFVFNAGALGNTTVELSDIDPTSQSFALTASGSIANAFYPDGSFTSVPWLTLSFITFLPGAPEITDVSFLGAAQPAGTSTSSSIWPGEARLWVSFPSPPLLDPFSWSATFELTTTGLLGSYTLFQAFAHEHCDPLPFEGFDCDGHGQQSDDVFDFAITPEPSAALVFAVGMMIVSQVGRRARRG